MNLSDSPCAVCGEEQPAAFQIYFDGDLKLYRCRQCGFVAQYPGPGRLTVVEDTQRQLELKEGQQWHYPARHAVLKDIVERVSRHRQGGDWLDVGCGDGQFISICRASGFHVVGIEPSAALASHAAATVDAEVRCGYYERGVFAAQTFDIISFVQVLEHLRNPKPVLEAALYHLRPDGLLVIEIPSIHAPHFLAYSWTGIKWFVKPPTGVIAPHQGYYCPRSLTMLVTGAGFSIAELTTGRWKAKYNGLLAQLARITDPLLNRYGIGGILLIGRKLPVQ